ncbi:DUF4342 domain-containing protein [Desulfolucanica intricata]|uniref:DUF4342 domain-containing protein n=1 Tax=Desulfolucanica intricata TaxID=1285191 RepID=UPI00082C45FE|nr:DUF4342 domain-containing protein [Desulfolucanica intricata]
MTSDLEKIDLIRARTGVSYKRANEALEKAAGDVVEALIELEEKNRKLAEKLQYRREDAWSQVKGLIQKGREIKIKLKKDDHVVFEVPATFGVLGLFGVMLSSELALLGAVGSLVAAANKYNLEIDRNLKENYLEQDSTEEISN